MKDYYDILEINENASVEVIKAAYKALARIYHPDNGKFPASVCENKMREINEAFDVLSNETKKKEYDLKRNATKQSSFGDSRKSSNAQTSQNYSTNNNQNAYREKQTDEHEEKEADDSSCEEVYETEAKKGKFNKFLHSFINGISEEIKRNNQVVENAYLDGLSMLDDELISKFKRTSGFKRTGYLKALKAKGFFYQDANGKLVPSEKFYYYWK